MPRKLSSKKPLVVRFERGSPGRWEHALDLVYVPASSRLVTIYLNLAYNFPVPTITPWPFLAPPPDTTIFPLTYQCLLFMCP